MRTATLTLVLLVLALPLSAAGPDQQRPRVFSVHDLDGDGYLSRGEYAALRLHCQERQGGRGRGRCDPARLLEFDALDGDRDGRIDEDELIDALGRRHRGGWPGRAGGPPDMPGR